MNKQKLLSKIQGYYGVNCVICITKIAEEIYPIVPHKVLRGARQMNKKFSRKSCKLLPTFNTFHPENILPVCKQCYCRAINGNIFQILNMEQRGNIDRIRNDLRFLELSNAESQRDFRHKLYYKITNFSKENASD